MVPFNHFFSIKDYHGYYGEDYYKKVFNNQSTKIYISDLLKNKK